MRTIDLHTHSTASDGSLSPRELIELAHRIGLAALGLTDHDTLDGLGELEEAGRERGIETVPGVEVNAEHSPGALHLLGYFVPAGPSPLASALEEIRLGRLERGERMARRLRELGVDVQLHEVLAEAGGASLGRPHFAAVLVRKGAAASVGEAFERYLDRDAPAHVSRPKPSPGRIIQLIESSGGIPVLAHPRTLEVEGAPDLETTVAELVKLGLRGLEVYYSAHSGADTARFLEIAGRFGLLVTGGSDFHGDARPEVELGRGLGELAVPIEVLERLRRARHAHRREGPRGSSGDHIT